MVSLRKPRVAAGSLAVMVTALAGFTFANGDDDAGNESRDRSSGHAALNAAEGKSNETSTDSGSGELPPQSWLLGVLPREAAARNVTLEKLEQPVSIALEDVPLREAVVKLLGDVSVRVTFDLPAIEASGSAALEEAISITAEEESVETVLFDLLDARNLVWLPRGNAIVVTTKEGLDSRRELIAYDVADLVVDDNGKADMEELSGLLQRAVAPDSWQDVGGTGSLTPMVRERAALLFVEQPFPIQRQIAKTLANLRLTGLAKAPPSSVTKFTLVPPRPRSVVSASMGYAESTPPPVADAFGGNESGQQPATSRASVPVFRPVEGVPLDISPEEAKLRSEVVAALQRPASIDCQDLPLAEAIREITAGLPFRLKFDRKAIDDDGTVSLDDPVTHATENEPVEAILFDLLQPRGLTWLPRGDSLVITTQSEADAHYESVAYDVSALVVDEHGHADFGTLQSLIPQMISPDGWDESGSPRQITPIVRERAALLVVRVPFFGQRQIRWALTALHRSGLAANPLPTGKITDSPLPVLNQDLRKPTGGFGGAEAPVPQQSTASPNDNAK